MKNNRIIITGATSMLGTALIREYLSHDIGKLAAGQLALAEVKKTGYGLFLGPDIQCIWVI